MNMLNDKYNVVRFGEESSNLIKNGVDKLSDAVKITLGPRGRNVIISKEDRYPHITKDGATVASSIKLENQIENIGALMIRDAAIKTAKEAGDGSTTATIYAQYIFNSLINSKEPITIVKDELIKIVEDFCSRISKKSKKCSKEQMVDIATLSANNDRVLGQFIYDVYERIGNVDLITLEKSESINNSVEYTDGIKLRSGLIATTFMNEKEKGLFSYENVMVHVVTHQIKEINDVSPYLNKEYPVLLIVNSISEYVLNTLIYNVHKGNIRLAVIRMPGFGTAKELYHKAIVEKLGGNSLVPKVTCTMSDCCIQLENQENKFEKELKDLEEEISNYSHEREFITYDIEALKDIYNIYSGKSAIVRIGGYSEGEIREKYDRAEDALMALKSAEDGYIYGSGVSVLEVIDEMSKDYKDNKYFKIIYNALIQPFVIMCNNIGMDPEESMSIIRNTLYSKLFNFKTLNYENTLESKVIEPVKVPICALTNAVNIANILLSTYCTIETIDRIL